MRDKGFRVKMLLFQNGHRLFVPVLLLILLILLIPLVLLFMTIVPISVPPMYGSLASAEVTQDIISDEERDILQSVRPGYGTRGILSTSFNIVNATVGSGILGVPYALHCGGFISGMAISCFVGLLTAVSLMMMIRAGIRANIFKYAQLSERALGRPGFHMLNFFVFIQASGSCISYFISECNSDKIIFPFRMLHIDCIPLNSNR